LDLAELLALACWLAQVPSANITVKKKTILHLIAVVISVHHPSWIEPTEFPLAVYLKTESAPDLHAVRRGLIHRDYAGI